MTVIRSCSFSRSRSDDDEKAKGQTAMTTSFSQLVGRKCAWEK